jgi:PAS domain S-box-containing protein
MAMVAEAVAREAEARQHLFQIMMACGVLGPLGGILGVYVMRGRERELRVSEQRYRHLFDQAPVPYLETDRAGMIRRFNQEAGNLLKLPPEKIRGCYLWDFVSPDQVDSVREAMLQRIATAGETEPYECEYLLQDGTRITVELRESLVRNDAGEVTGVLSSILDVTQRNLAAIAARKVAQYASELRNKNEQLGRALDAARSATDAKSRFLASVSHELRTPLNSIIGFSEMLHDSRIGPVTDEQREILSDILGSARHLLHMISDILDLTKIEAGKMEFRPEPATIEGVVNEVRDSIWPLAERKKLHLTAEVSPGLHAVIDPARFKQVLYNYLSNAVKFTPAGGSVKLRVTPEGDAAFRVEVEDTGIGIPPEEMPLLFNEFQQLPNSRKAEQGTGLGLALTRHIVEVQGGTVSARSILGRGSTFVAVLPRNPRAGSISSEGS